MKLIPIAVKFLLKLHTSTYAKAYKVKHNQSIKLQ